MLITRHYDYRRREEHCKLELIEDMRSGIHKQYAGAKKRNWRRGGMLKKRPDEDVKK